jgi:hypothetical protein
MERSQSRIMFHCHMLPDVSAGEPGSFEHLTALAGATGFGRVAIVSPFEVP